MGDYDEEIEAQRALSRRLTQERYGDNRWWTRKPPPRTPTEEQYVDTPLLQARRRRALEREMTRHDTRDQGVADAGA